MIETLVYQYFEPETIEKFEFFPLIELRRYLRRCREAILSTLDVHRHRTNFFRGSVLSNSEHKLKDRDDFLLGYMSETIKNEAKKFVFEIVKMSKNENPYQTDPNSNIFPRQALLKDHKFLSILQEIRKDFGDGCKNFCSEIADQKVFWYVVKI